MTEIPFNEEQIKKLNEISQLPFDEQQRELQKLLPSFTPEQVEFLKKQQRQETDTGCPFCAIVKGKIASHKVYEDDNYLGILDINPATKGHVLLIPKKHIQVMGEIKDVGGLFNTANNISSTLIEMGAAGTNILASNGKAAGQNSSHFILHVIPRYPQDGVNFSWNNLKVNEEELVDLAKRIKNSLPSDNSAEVGQAEEQAKKFFYTEKERIA